jgi:hypothetical protein
MLAFALVYAKILGYVASGFVAARVWFRKEIAAAKAEAKKLEAAAVAEVKKIESKL